MITIAQTIRTRATTAAWSSRMTSVLWMLALLIAWGASSSAHAHLMVSQRGTLNFVDESAFMVLSVPASALTGVDDDGDGKLSTAEFNAHYQDVESQLEQRLELRDEDGPRPLQGLLINSSTEHDNAGSIDQLVLMGRFALASPEGTVWLHTDLFGEEEHERSLQIKATREDQVQLVVLTPDRNDAAIFPDRRHVLFEYVELGIDHILTGFDHVLLLLLVLATGWGWRRVTVALTCFTLGHAVTLVASVTGTVELSPALVEPAIAATLFGMAVFDWMAENRRWAIANQWRMVLVFACALVHGLGLASSLNELGLRDAHQLHSLVGFNVGIEIGQLLIATVAMLVLEVVRRVGGRAVYALALKIVSFVAVVMGAAWFVERVVM